VLDCLKAKRYVVPLREGGSLPAVVDTEGGGQFVVKFMGAGQGPKALIAESLAAGLARVLGLPVPAPAVVVMAEGFGRGEPDPEIQDILRGSVGPNFGLAYLPGAIGFDDAVDLEQVSPDLAADIVWFDAYIGNPDRSPRNPNLLLWRDAIWMIDHGAAFYFHHRWAGWEERVHRGIPRIDQHVLLPRAAGVAAADARLRPHVSAAAIRELVSDLPEAWLPGDAQFPDVEAQRQAYVTYLLERLHGPRTWLMEAIDAQRSR
jgi:hypothetical protein